MEEVIADLVLRQVEKVDSVITTPLFITLHSSITTMKNCGSHNARRQEAWSTGPPPMMSPRHLTITMRTSLLLVIIQHPDIDFQCPNILAFDSDISPLRPVSWYGDGGDVEVGQVQGSERGLVFRWLIRTQEANLMEVITRMFPFFHNHPCTFSLLYLVFLELDC